MLTLSEELYLALHFNEKEKSIVSLEPSTSQLATAGGLTTELLLAGHLRLDENQLVVLDASATGDNLLDEALHCLQPSVRFNANDGEWFSDVAQKLPLGQAMLARLLEKGVIRPLQKSKWFGLSQTTTYPLQNEQITARWHQLQVEVLLNGGQPTVRDAVLLFMTRAWGTSLPATLSRQEWKTAENRWEKLFGDYWGMLPGGEASEPIPGLDTAVRQAIGHLTVAWAAADADNHPFTD
jgi:hypothetical protein